jgi:NADPH:quinone reductase-like Zn-dependent oxidoreductase
MIFSAFYRRRSELRKHMKAIVYKRYGPPDVLLIDEVDKPAPRNDEVLIKIFAAEATKSDCEMRSFQFAVKWFWLPLRIGLGIRKPKREILGGYFAGQVESFGKDVSRFSVGDQVFGSAQLRMGSYGEYLCLPSSYTVVPKPQNLSFAEAAAVPLGGFNALHYMRKANIKSGEKVLINGAGASIGTFAVQIAKAMGGEVTAVDSGIKEEMLRSIGADHFIDYSQEDFTKRGQSYDVIFNMVANTSYSACIGALRPGGRYLMGNPRLSDMLRSVFTPLLTDKTVTFTFARETEEELLALKKMIEIGEIRPMVDQVYPMEQAAEAHRRVETEQRLGIIVIAMAPDVININDSTC